MICTNVDEGKVITYNDISLVSEARYPWILCRKVL